jgi:hypothetical protein
MIKLVCNCGYTFQFSTKHRNNMQVEVTHCPVCDTKPQQTLCQIWLTEMAAKAGKKAPSTDMGPTLWNGFEEGLRDIIEKGLY